MTERAGCRRGASALAAFLAVLLLFAGPCAGQRKKRVPELSDDLLQEREGLLALERAVTDPGLSKLRTWSADGNPCFPKPWKHVTCANGRVVSLNLANLKMQGTLPRQLRLLNALVTLNLEGNLLTGRVPDGWADPNFFLALRSLSLQNNALSGPLPNRKWNAAKAWPSLEELDLSGNQLWGGLPDGWLSTAKVFKGLRYLDLSGNCLGFSDACVTPLAPGAWCLAGSQAATGWCPSGTPLAGTAAKLETLDLSGNGLIGALPLKWPRMFPALKYFYLASNALTAGATVTPALLPADWTRVRVPRAFPKLQTLVLYPGNPNICFLPDGDTDGNGYIDVAGVATYTVADADLRDYTPQDPWTCPPPAADNPPTWGGIDQTRSQGLIVKFGAPAASDTPVAVYGYKVTIHTQDPDTEDWAPLTLWNGRLLRTYQAALPAGLTQGSATPADYTLDTGVTLALGTVYRVRITTFNVDGWESAPAENVFTAAAKKWSYYTMAWGGLTASFNLGQLGNGGTSGTSTPSLVQGGDTWTAVDMGSTHTCFLDSSGAAYCTGDNASGKLGDGTTTSRSSPTAVLPPAGASTPLKFASISAGESHTCGVVNTASRPAFCWGAGSNGQLGQGAWSSSSIPIQVSGSTQWKAISAGRLHTCGIAGDDSVLCWGPNMNGEVGTGNTLAYNIPTPIVQVNGVTLKFASISTGFDFTCGLTLPPASTIYCFGYSNWGQLGANRMDSSRTPVAVAGDAASITFSSISVGLDHVCAIAEAGNLWCFGRNDVGQLGDGSSTTRSVPVLATSANAQAPWSSVALYGRTTCAIKKADMTMWCWGYGGDGQLGSGSTTNSATPVQVSGGYTWQSVTVGTYTTAGLRAN